MQKAKLLTLLPSSRHFLLFTRTFLAFLCSYCLLSSFLFPILHSQSATMLLCRRGICVFVRHMLFCAHVFKNIYKMLLVKSFTMCLPSPQASCFEGLLEAAVCTYNPLLVLAAYISPCECTVSTPAPRGGQGDWLGSGHINIITRASLHTSP